MIHLVKHPRVDSRQLLHAEVNFIKAQLHAVKQKLGYARGNGCSVVGLSELHEVQPLAAQTLLRAKVDVVGERAQSADDVHVRHTEGAGVVVLLPDTEQRSEFRSNPGFLIDFTNCSSTWEELIKHVYGGIQKILFLTFPCQNKPWRLFFSCVCVEGEWKIHIYFCKDIHLTLRVGSSIIY